MTFRSVCSTALCATLAVCSLAAKAQNLKLRELFAHDREQVASLARGANQACGTNIAFSVDYSTYDKVLDDDNNQRPWAYLANATDALKSVCSSDEGKKAVQEKIKTVVVSHGDSETESLNAGTFRYSVPYSGHAPQTVIAWLKSNL
jgi:hypothetical protein